MKTIVHVHRQRIARNLKTGAREPPIIARTYRGVRHGSRVRIDGPCEIIYSPDNPLACGARVWIETTAKVTVD